jgi:hypothetical protein
MTDDDRQRNSEFISEGCPNFDREPDEGAPPEPQPNRKL